MQAISTVPQKLTLPLLPELTYTLQKIKDNWLAQERNYHLPPALETEHALQLFLLKDTLQVLPITNSTWMPWMPDEVVLPLQVKRSVNPAQQFLIDGDGNGDHLLLLLLRLFVKQFISLHNILLPDSSN